MVIVPEKKENLPVLLPTDVEFTGKGESPLTTSKTFVLLLVHVVEKKLEEKLIQWIHSLILLGTS